MANYSQLPLGMHVSGGKIEKCPHCGNPALVTLTNEVAFFLHAEKAVKSRDGNTEIIAERCPQMPVPEYYRNKMRK